MYVLPKINKWLYNAPGCSVKWNCDTLTDKVSEFLDHDLQLVMKSGKSYVKDTGDFLEKIKSLGRITKDAFLVTADVVGLYPSIPHDAGLKALHKKLEERSDKFRSACRFGWHGRICTQEQFLWIWFKSQTTNLWYCHRDHICTTIGMYVHG